MASILPGPGSDLDFRFEKQLVLRLPHLAVETLLPGEGGVCAALDNLAIFQDENLVDIL